MGCAERKRVGVLLWWREVDVVEGLEGARKRHHEFWVGDKMVVAGDAGTWSEAKGSKLAVRTTCGRRVGKFYSSFTSV